MVLISFVVSFDSLDRCSHGIIHQYAVSVSRSFWLPRRLTFGVFQ